jgi:hypothetical protein
MPAQCGALLENTRGGGINISAKQSNPVTDCLNQAGYHELAVYQPSYRYWDFQRIEAGIYLAMATLATGVTYWLVLRRDA